MSGASPAFGPRDALPFEAIMRQVEGITLDAVNARLDGVDAALTARSRDDEQVAALAARLLTDEFRPLMERLCDETFRRPLVAMGLGQDAMPWLWRREGAVLLMGLIFNLARAGQGAPPAFRE